MRMVAIIPARYKSSRFPGKPLADIFGKPMIWWVYNEALKVKDFDEVIVATESDLIEQKCFALGMKCMLTSDEHPSGIDRVAEIAQRVPADIYFVIMGDEPMIRAEDEQRLVDKVRMSLDADMYMLVETFSDPVDVVNMTTIKLALNDDGDVVFISRMPIPYPKGVLGYKYYKTVGCMAMTQESLEFFRRTKPGNLERAEDTELLRLIEHHRIIKTMLIDGHPMAVDTTKDLARVREYLATQSENNMGGG